MKRLLYFVLAVLLVGGTSNRLRERRSVETAARELGISTDSLMRKVAELDALTQRLKDAE